ncbi:hypothetical protein RND81_08G137800 [Saponaria officinalis]|uniref:FLZ-type domain-containing protein n=1 Tax=Saponaria officinalis TaxID=3572 RepID=A0AAW1J7V6_SAPOF
MDSQTTTTSSTIRRPCFIGEDHGLASIAHFSTKINNNNNYNNNNTNTNNYVVDYENHMMRRRNSLRNISSLSSTMVSTTSTTTTTSGVYSPRSARVFESRYEEVYTPHFLESCALCHKPLGGNRDIFMYRGDTPFCSEECRQEQIDMDDAKEKNWNLKALRSKKDSKKSSSSSSSSSKAQNYPFRTGTVAAA